MSNLKKIKKQAKDFGGLPFWSWNDKLEKEELIRQIRYMKESGLNGFFMHARGGLKTEYCSDEWYDCINACVKEAKKLKMEAWAYDENGWPSGFAGGELLTDPKNHVAFLESAVGEFDENAFASYLIGDDGTYKLVEDNAPDGKYLNVCRKYTNAYVDVMDASVIKKFIDATHEQYKIKVGKEFGKTMPGFFTDEPQYYRYSTAWSDTFLKTFEEAYGYSVFNVLPALFADFEGAKELRYDYWLLCHRQYTYGFAKQIYDWCTENGVQLTGHSIEETSVAFQMCCSGGVMPFYEFQHIPGIDFLTRDICGDLMPKQLGSVVAQLNKKKALTESFACCGWDVSPLELKRITQWQFVAGVNLLCPHLYPYSERGERKYDHPAHYGDMLPWGKYLADFNNYFANVASFMSQGKEKANVLIIHPMHSVYLYFNRDKWDTCASHIEAPFQKLINKYGDYNVQYHLGDETIMARHARVENKSLIVGACKYDYVVIPYLETLDSSTVALLKEYIANGGRIVVEDTVPTRIDGKEADLSFIKANATFEDILANRDAYLECDGSEMVGVRLNLRDTASGRIFYIANTTDTEFKNATLRINNCKGLNRIHALDLSVCGIKTEIEDNEIIATFDLPDSGSLLLEETSKPAKYVDASPTETVFTVNTDGFAFVNRPENAITLDYASISYDGVTYEPIRYIKHIHELLLKRKRSGKTYLKFTFNAEYVADNLLLCVEPLDDIKITVNGTEVSLTDDWRIDRRFHTTSISGCTKAGVNEIVLEFDYHQSDSIYSVLFNSVMESLRNSLSLDTEIEPIYIFGDFGVSSDKEYTDGKNGSKLNDGVFTLIKPENSIDISDIVTESYPFYCGEMTVKKVINAEAGKYLLSFDGRFSALKIKINGKDTENVMLGRSIIADLQEGENTIEISMVNSLRNIFGPLHSVNDESYAIGPRDFTNEGMWSEAEESSQYVKRYSFMRFGIDPITFTRLK